MIDYVKGRVQHVGMRQLSIFSESLQLGFTINVLDVNSFFLGDMTELYLYMHWNQEQGPSLYGFKTMLERELFILINGCAGIGPKMALAILSQIDVADFVQAIQSSDIKTLSRLKGIGAKKAEQLILQLKDKVDRFASSYDIDTIGAAKHVKQLSEVLQSLNYSRAEIQQVIHQIHSYKFPSEPSFDQVMRQALSFLAKKV